MLSKIADNILKNISAPLVLMYFISRAYNQVI